MENTYACKYCGTIVFDTGNSFPDNQHKCSKCGATGYVLISDKEAYQKHVSDGSINNFLMHKCTPYESSWFKHWQNLTPTSGEQPKYMAENNQLPHCPVCGSANLSKITTAHKVGKVMALGVFGMGDNGKTWKCNNCGSRF